MSTQYAVMYIAIIAIVILIVLLYPRAHIARSGGERSAMEAMIIAIIEDLTQHQFNQARPKWLRDRQTGARLELDGYNKELQIAFEIQGPHHFKQLPNESYEQYIARVDRDIYKRKECEKHGVKLIIIDYNIKSRAALRNYIASRLFDVNCPGIEKPMDYIAPLDMTPWVRGSASFRDSPFPYSAHFI